MKPSISTTRLVTALVGTGLLVFNAMGLSISVGQFAPTRSLANPLVLSGLDGAIFDTLYLSFWTPSQRAWMTIGCLLIVGGKLFDARFRRG
jgi:hypothetical protein